MRGDRAFKAICICVMILQLKLGTLKSPEASESLLKNLFGFPNTLRPNFFFITIFSLFQFPSAKDRKVPAIVLFKPAVLRIQITQLPKQTQAL